MHYEGECPVPGCGRPARDYHGDGEEIICYEHYLYDRAVMRRLHPARQSWYATCSGSGIRNAVLRPPPERRPGRRPEAPPEPVEATS